MKPRLSGHSMRITHLPKHVSCKWGFLHPQSSRPCAFQPTWAGNAQRASGTRESSDTDRVVRIAERQKADILLRIDDNDRRSLITLSLKKANAKSNFNQVDKRSVEAYQAFWGFDDNIRLWLRLFTGAASLAEFNRCTEGLTVDARRRRVQFRHLSIEAKREVLEFLETNKRAIVTDVLQGRGTLAAQHVMVTQHSGNTIRVHLCEMNKVLDYALAGPVAEGPRSSVCLGRLTMQRYGGSPHPELLQFKIKPGELFNVEGLTRTVRIA